MIFFPAPSPSIGSQPPAHSSAHLRVRSRVGSLARLWFVIVCLSALFIPYVGHANSDFESPGSGILLLHHDGGAALPAMQLDASINVEASGLLADVTLTQTFRNTHTEWAEGRYLFPLPADATIRGLVVTVGDRSIIGEVKPRAEAKTTYEKAKNAGQVASLVEQQRPNLFTVNVASIKPQDEIKVSLDILLPISVVDGAMQLTFPTTLTPRYTNSQTTDAQNIIGSFTQISEQRGPRLNFHASIVPLADYSQVSSSTHTLQTEHDRIVFTDVPMDRDLILRWPFTLGNSESTYSSVRTHNGQRYAQILLTPPNTTEQSTVSARELILIIDKSGSMAGVSMRAAREALHFALDSLNNQDRFNIVAFDDQTYPLFPASREVNNNTIAEARRFIDKLDAGGGTEMYQALDFALRKSRPSNNDDYPETNRLKQVVFMTDGSVGNEHSLLNTIKQNLGTSRLFTVGIGAAPNSWFLQEAAEAGRGVALSIKDEYDVAGPLTKLLDDLSIPILTNIGVQTGSGQFELYPKPIADLYASSPLMLVAKIDNDVDSFIVTGQLANSRWRQVVNLNESQNNEPMATDANSAPSLAMHWTRSKIDSLLDEQRYAADNEMHAKAITQLALAVGLQTQYTSFVAIEAIPVKPTTEPMVSQEVANLIPAGNDMLNVALPQGSAGTDTLLMLSALLGLFGTFGLALERRLANTSGRV